MQYDLGELSNLSGQTQHSKIERRLRELTLRNRDPQEIQNHIKTIN